MKNHTRQFFKHYGIDKHEVFCPICERPAVDLHHPKGRPMGNTSKKYDDPVKLLPLCREHHEEAERDNWSAEYCAELKAKWIKMCFKLHIKLKNKE
jgi:hypothetical protein